MAAKPNKTRPTIESVDQFLAKVGPESRRADAIALKSMMERASGAPAQMWGPSIVGCGVRRYRYASGREGEICRIGFSPRKDAFALYGLGEDHTEALALGKVTTGKGCVYIKRLADIDAGKLEALLSARR
jgi:hypothetical protein